MLELIKSAFPVTDFDLYVQTIKTAFSIVDTENKYCVVKPIDESLKHFSVYNDKQRSIHFLAIDRGIIPATDATKRCDCAVFDYKTFCFVEIKVVATGKRSQANRTAKEQLRQTILLFKERIEFTTKRLEAYACVGGTTPRPARRATDLDELVEFEEELGVPLYHGNEKRFA